MFDKRKMAKELEKKMLIKKSINEMNKQISKLEQQEKVYIDAAKRALKQGLKAQVNLALSGLKMTLSQKKRAQEMLLNFEITSQMKDMAAMTGSFLQSMGTLSKEMMRLTDEKQFGKVQQQFEQALAGAEMQAEQMSLFLENSESAFSSNASAAGNSEVSDEELKKFIESEAIGDYDLAEDIDKELQELQKRNGNA
jgi:hypothetical protein